MGDRSNVAIDFGKDESGKPQRVYLYSHWDGKEIALALRDSIKAGRRLDDPQYFARILFDRMIGKHQGEETGYGISPFVCDNSYRILVVDCDARCVVAEDNDAQRWSFSAFADFSDEEVMQAMDRAQA